MLRWIGIILLLIVGLLGIGLAVLATPLGHGAVASLIERTASTNGLSVTIDRVRGWPPFWLQADKVAIADAKGPAVEIENLAVDVRLLSLLVGTISLEELTADRVSVARKPVLAESDGRNGAILPFTVDKFAVTQLSLSDAVAGRSAILTVEGSASASAGGALALNVHAERIDGVAGELDAQLTRPSSGDWLTADIVINEAPDGILIGLMSRVSGPAYSLSAKAAAMGNDMQGSVTLSSNERAQFNGQFAVTSEGEASRVALRGSGDLAELVPPDFADLLSGTIDVGFDADWVPSEDGSLPQLSIRSGTFRTATVNGQISGQLSRSVADLALTVEVADPTGQKIDLPLTNLPSQIESASLRGTVKPSNGIPRLDLVGRIVGLKVDQVTISSTGVSLAVESSTAEPLAGGKMPFAARLEADAIGTASGRIDASGDARLLLTAEGAIDAENARVEGSADLRAGGGRATFTGTVSAKETDGKLGASFSDIHAVAALFGRDYAGGLEGTAEGTFFGDCGSTLAVAADLTDFRPGGETLDRLLRGRTVVSANISSTPERVHRISDLSVKGDAFEGSGEATIEAGNVEASLDGTIADLSILADRSIGAATFTAALSGPLPYPEVDATIKVADGSLLDQAIENASARVQGQPSATGWSGTLALDGTLADKPLAGSAEFVLTADTGEFALPAVDLTIADNRITGALERTGGRTVSGELDVTAPNLQALAALALSEATGSANALIRFTPDGDRQAIAASFEASDLTYRSFAARTASGQVRIADAFGTPMVDGEATAETIEAGAVRLDSLKATATVEGGETRFDMAAKGADLDLTGKGALTSAEGANVVRLDSLSGSAFRVPVVLAEPVTLQLGDRVQITKATLAIGNGRVVVDGSASSNLDLHVTASQVPASVANGFAPNLNAAGTVSGSATISGAASAPKIAWQLDWTGLQVAATRNASLPPLALTASGNATRSATDIRGTLSGAGLSLGLGGSVPFSGGGLNVTVKGPAPLSLLALRSNRELRLTGNANLDLQVTGTTRSPDVSGTVTLADATAVDIDTGFGVSGATGRIALNGQRASIEQISGRMAQGGQIAIAGTVDLKGANFPSKLTIRVDNGRYNDGRLVNAQFNASLALDGPLMGGATLSGNVALGRTEIQLPDRLGGGATALDVKHINPEPGFTPPKLSQAGAADRRSGSGSLRLAIDLTSNGSILVRGFGIDSEFGGSLRLTNTIANPTTAGAFDMRRGRIEVLGRRFQLVSGRLTFSGDLVPVVDFVATTNTSDTVIHVTVTGRANDPIIGFNSNPDLPDEEILSRLLFDRQVSRLSAVQAAQLVDAAAQLSGVGGGRGIFASVREALGVDDLDIRQNDSGGTTVGIGKRINENLRLGVEAGSGSQSGRVTIDLDLTRDLKLRGAAGQSGSGELGLSYEREY